MTSDVWWDERCGHPHQSCRILGGDGEEYWLHQLNLLYWQVVQRSSLGGVAVDYPQSEHGRVGQLDEEKHEEVLNYINMYRDLLEVIKTEFDAPRRLFEGEVQDMKSDQIKGWTATGRARSTRMSRSESGSWPRGWGIAIQLERITKWWRRNTTRSSWGSDWTSTIDHRSAPPLTVPEGGESRYTSYKISTYLKNFHRVRREQK